MKISIILKYTGNLLFWPFWQLQLLIPRRKDIWIFGAWYGQKFSDNCSVFFKYISKNYPEIRCIWLSREKELVKTIKTQGFEAYFVNSLSAIYFSMLAKAVFVSSGKKDINPFFINGSCWFQLWHGSPLKKISLDDRYTNPNGLRENIKKKFFPFIYEFNYHYSISSAYIFSDKLASAFNLEREKVLLTGYPRNDLLFSGKMDPLIKKWKQKFNDPKVITYLPTFRSEVEKIDLFGDYQFNGEDFQNFLKEHNALFVTKGHFVDSFLSPKSDFDRIIHLSDKEVKEVYLLLKDTDLLLTDYSSIYFDFLLTQKPVIFTPFDLKQYLSHHREFYFNYQDIVGGPVAKNWPEVLEELKVIFDNDSFESIRMEKNKVFNHFHDGQNCDRLFKEVVNVLHLDII